MVIRKMHCLSLAVHAHMTTFCLASTGEAYACLQIDVLQVHNIAKVLTSA